MNDNDNNNNNNNNFFANLDETFSILGLIVCILCNILCLSVIFFYTSIARLRRVASSAAVVLICLHLTLYTVGYYAEFVSTKLQSRSQSGAARDIACGVYIFFNYFGGLGTAGFSTCLAFQLVHTLRNPLSKSRKWLRIFMLIAWPIAIVITAVTYWQWFSSTSENGTVDAPSSSGAVGHALSCTFSMGTAATVDDVPLLPGVQPCSLPSNHVIHFLQGSVALVYAICTGASVAYSIVVLRKGFPGTQTVRRTLAVRMVVFAAVFSLFWAFLFFNRITASIISSLPAGNAKSNLTVGMEVFTMVFKLGFYAQGPIFAVIFLTDSIILFWISDRIARFQHRNEAAAVEQHRRIRRLTLRASRTGDNPLANTLLAVEDAVDDSVGESEAELSEYESNVQDSTYFEQMQKQQARIIQSSSGRYDNIDLVVRRDLVLCIMYGLSMSIMNGTSMRGPIGEEHFVERRLNSLFCTLNRHRFKFQEYAPRIFGDIRHRYQISDVAFLESFKPEDVYRKFLLTNFSEGKSGSFFCVTRDNRYMIKTIAANEVKLLLKILPQMHQYLVNNRDTFLIKILGLYELQLYLGYTVKVLSQDRVVSRILYWYSHIITSHNIITIAQFIVINNVFDNRHCPAHQRYDLKGSWIDRTAKPGRNLKLDNDLKELLVMEPDMADFMERQITKDCEFLRSVNIMDYSLLLGAHEMEPNWENDEPSTGGNFLSSLRRGFFSRQGSQTNHPDTDTSLSFEERQKHYDQDSVNRYVPLHKRFLGGIPTSDRNKVLFIGIIDILQSWNLSKRLENFYKTRVLMRDPAGISCIAPELYAKRFKSRVIPRFKSEVDISRSIYTDGSSTLVLHEQQGKAEEEDRL